MDTFYNVVDAAGYQLIKCAGVIEFADDRQAGEDWAIEYTDADEAEEDAAKFGGTVETYQRSDRFSMKPSEKALIQAMALVDQMESLSVRGLSPDLESIKAVKEKLTAAYQAVAA